MIVTERCAKCLYDGQKKMTDDPRYLAEVRRILHARREEDCAPYMVYLFDRAYRELFGPSRRYADLKKRYNDLVLAMEDGLRRRIEEAADPLARSLAYARVGNYIDFAAMENVNEDAFLALFDSAELGPGDRTAYASLLAACAGAKEFLLICDNCGEIVLDRLMLEQLHRRFPGLKATAMVRGGEALNDATVEDAVYVGMGRAARVVSNGAPIVGTIYPMLSEEARLALDRADVVLSKGQGNYESLTGQGRHIFYSFLCKCDLFMEKFRVPRFTGLLLEEKTDP